MPILQPPTPDQEKAALMKRINEVLRRLRIPGHTKGYHCLSYMLMGAVLDQRQLDLITKTLYPDTARYLDVPVSRVERNARTAISTCWERGGREALDQMAGYHLAERPTVSGFLDIVADYIRRTS